MIRINGIRLPFTADADALHRKIAAICRVSPEEILRVRLLRRSLDARKKQDISFLMNVAVELSEKTEKRILRRGDSGIEAYEAPTLAEIPQGSEAPKGRIVVVGLGPAGLFCAWLLALRGYRPLVIERGRPVEERVRDVEHFWSHAELDPESNVMFGEGGAGTFSDGKLTSRSKDPRGATVLSVLTEHGAPDEIEYMAKPHIGTDRLRTVVSSMRKRIEALGGEVCFHTKLVGVRTVDGALQAIEVQKDGVKERIPCAALVLAIGLGARDTVRMLLDAGLAVQPKAFAVGCRVEHPQELIDRAQFGAFGGDPRLGAAEYHLSARSGSRGVYTFCMCPGGKVVASASGPDQLVVNGMSDYARDAENANAAVIVQVGPEDFGTDPLAGVRFCEQIEKQAFLAGGGAHLAPASRAEDLLLQRKSAAFSGVHPSYRPGVQRVNLWECLPEFVAQGVADGIRAFGSQLQGYDLPDAVVTAVESRTSAPLRMLRGENGESVTVRGVYPVGEGTGYAGGIVSAAIDGLRAAERLIARFCPSFEQ